MHNAHASGAPRLRHAEGYGTMHSTSGSQCKVLKSSLNLVQNNGYIAVFTILSNKNMEMAPIIFSGKAQQAS